MKNMLVILLLVLAGSNCFATLTEINSAESWTAGTDDLNAFYGSGYLQSGESAVLNDSTNGSRALFYGTQIVQSGLNSYSFESKFTSYYRQYNYFNVYLFNDGALFPLTDELGLGMTPYGASQIAANYAPASNDGGLWYSYDLEFEITEPHLSDYNYIGFYFVGSKGPDQELAYSNFSFNLPEPTTILMLGLGGILIVSPYRREIYSA